MSEQNNVLDEAQRARFERDGFLLVSGFFGLKEMAEITRWTDEVTAWPEAPGRHMVYYEDSLGIDVTQVHRREASSHRISGSDHRAGGS